MCCNSLEFTAKPAAQGITSKEFNSLAGAMINAVSLVARHIYNFEEKVWTEAAKKGVALAAMKVFGGQASGKDPKGARMPAELRHAAIRYALGLPQVSVVVVGSHDEAELKQNLAWAKEHKPLTKQELAGLGETTEKLAKQWGSVYGPVL